MFIQRTLLNVNKLNSISIKTRHYSKSKLDEIERLRQGYSSNHQVQESNLSNSIMDRIENARKMSASTHDSEFYSANNNDKNVENIDDDDEYLPTDQFIKISGRDNPRRIKKSEIEVVSMKDY